MYSRQKPLHQMLEDIDSSYDSIKKLLDDGADVNAKGFRGTPLELALRCQPLPVVKLLIDRGANFNERGTALHIAAENRNTDVLRYVIGQGVDIDAEDKYGSTAIWYALVRKNVEGCRILLENNIKFDAVFKWIIKLSNEVERDNPNGYNTEKYVKSMVKSTQLELLIEHLVLRECQGTHQIEQTYFAKLHKFDYLVEYYNRCSLELNRMKEIKIYEDIHLYDVFVAKQSVLAGFCRNDDLVKAVGRIEEATFPIYFPTFKKKFDAEAEKQKHYKAVANFLSDIFGFNDPYHLVTRRIMDFMTYEDVKCLGKIL